MSIATISASRQLALGGWRDALTALAATAVIVLAGEAFGAAMSDAASRILTDSNPVFIRVATPGIVAAYQIALLWFIAGWWFGGERRQALGLHGARVSWWIWPAAIVGLYVLKAVVSIAVLFAFHGPGSVDAGASSEAVAPFGSLMRSPAWPLLVLGGVLAAVVEEVLYRGYLSRTLEASRLGFWAGAAVASIVWAALHVYYPLPMQLVLVVMGLALSWLRARTGSILPGMAWHIANNLIALIALRLMS